MQDPKQYLQDYLLMKMQSKALAEALAVNINQRDILLPYKTKVDQALDECLDVIQSLSDARYRSICTMRYVKGMSWVQIADKLCYDRSSVFKLHKKALSEVKKRVNHE